MKKSNIIKMILAYHGYEVTNIENYRAGGTQGTIVSVWEVEAENKDIDDTIIIRESSFQEALQEIFEQLKDNKKVKVNFIDEFAFREFI